MNNFKIFIILAIIVATILVCVLQPKMHKIVVIGDVNFVVVQEENQPQSQTQIPIQNPQERKNLPTQTQKIQVKPKTSTNKEKPSKRIQEKVVREVYPPKAKPQVETKQPAEQKRKLTAEEEEIIAWNTWRSNLQNKVMKDTKLSAPIGTVFRFSFTVDREGTISNLKTWSDNSMYTPTAVRAIKPMLLSYQGQSILNFPPESKRVITNVNGKFITWYSSSYSTPSDYSDYEKVKR